MTVALRLASRGYCGGDPEKVLEMRADLIIAALQYESFKGEYESAFMALNAPQAK